VGIEGISLSRGSMEGASGRAPLPGNRKDEVFERDAKCPLSGLPLYRGPLGEPGGGSFTMTFERNE